MALKTPLYEWHRSHGAKMVEFGGWDMPVSYEGVLAEHKAVREACGLFDISHMGEIFISGAGSENALQWLTSNDVSRLRDGQAQYSLLLNEKGGAVDDIIVYRLKPDRFLVCVNAANIDKDREWMKANLKPDAELTDRSPEMGMIALQGPASPRVLAKLGFDLASVDRFHCRELRIAGAPVLLARTGYTGEEGCEFFLESKALLDFWEELLAAGRSEGLVPVGLGARDTLRLEMGYPLYGHELNESLGPWEAGLGWVVKLDAKDFIGKPALLEAKAKGVAKRVRGLRMEEPGIPREGFAVYRGADRIGATLSGTFSPSLNVGIATALLDADAGVEGGEIFVDIRGKMKKAKITKIPFLNRKIGAGAGAL
ncbi:MAG TPA: glycine cleavage system aminomethyltransferase GcvT [bacterium]|nr:glycine cleavage system aminomethyltransferase GcvT [bacterium]